MGQFVKGLSVALLAACSTEPSISSQSSANTLLDSGIQLPELVSGESESTSLVKTGGSRLEGDGTIPRVKNPPSSSDLANLPGDLRAIPVPGPGVALDTYVANRTYALALGKAWFWDMQVGSDGITACASCHFRGGADPRSKNQLSPGLVHYPNPDYSFERGTGPNYQLSAADFPMTRLLTPGQRGALDPALDSNDAVASQGVHHLGSGQDPDGFQVGGIKTRRVEPRNTPSMINAVFNHRQFWDGRAEATFNGANHVGARDPNAHVLKAVLATSTPEVHKVALPNSSLASQAVAPIVSTLEMAAPGTTPAQIGRNLTQQNQQRGKKLRSMRPLGKQVVAKDDSVLGPFSAYPENGLTITTYEAMIRTAFKREFWDSAYMVRVAADGTRTYILPAAAEDGDSSTQEYTLAEYNFALFFGIAVQMYESTLVADDTEWDRFRREHPSSTDPALNPWNNHAPSHISRLALFGAMLFNDRTRGATNIRCSNCHESAELTDASSRRVLAAVNGPVRNRDGNVIDKGFNNIGVRPTADDLGAGASDAFGPISHTRRLFPGQPPTSFDGAAVTQGFGVDGAFKIPSLRNVMMTAPFFHNGDALTLRDAVELYSRGGNVHPIKALAGNNIEPLGVPHLTNDEIEAIVAFLESLTDDRVVYRKAPFDHPQLIVPNGHPGQHLSTTDKNLDGLADDRWVEIPAVGARGGKIIYGFLEGPFGSLSKE